MCAKFDIRASHDQVLDAGALPMDVLEKRIDDWIAGAKYRKAMHAILVKLRCAILRSFDKVNDPSARQVFRK
jgi:hypothetical protein